MDNVGMTRLAIYHVPSVHVSFSSYSSSSSSSSSPSSFFFRLSQIHLSQHASPPIVPFHLVIFLQFIRNWPVLVYLPNKTKLMNYDSEACCRKFFHKWYRIIHIRIKFDCRYLQYFLKFIRTFNFWLIKTYDLFRIYNSIRRS